MGVGGSGGRCAYVHGSRGAQGGAESAARRAAKGSVGETQEQMSQRKVLHMNHPQTIEEISAPWMTDVLRGAGILRRATVRAVDVHAIGQGVGFLSGRARVTLTYDQAEEGAPATVVVKMPASIKESVAFADATHAYE